MQRLYRTITKENTLAAELGLGSLDTCYPDLDAWNNRVEALPAFAATFPPHWRD
jgi:glutathione S-transferase